MVGLDAQRRSNHGLGYGGLTHTALSIQGEYAVGVTCHESKGSEVVGVVDVWVVHIQFQLVLVLVLVANELLSYQVCSYCQILF
jgi:hypothetical protein